MAPLLVVDALPEGERVSLAGPEGSAGAAVRRLRIGDDLLIGDGRGATATALVTGIGRSTLELRITGRSYEQPPATRLVGVVPAGKADKGEAAVQVMAEAGVDEIVPWPAGRAAAQWRGEPGERSWRRWALTARTAATMVRRSWLPTVAPAAATPAVATRIASAGVGLVLDQRAEARLTEVPLPETGELVLVVGPESGVPAKDLAALEAAGAVRVRLGGATLPTATAGVAALSVLSTRLHRW